MPDALADFARETRAHLLAELTLEERLRLVEDLPPEERLRGLTPEDRREPRKRLDRDDS